MAVTPDQVRAFLQHVTNGLNTKAAAAAADELAAANRPSWFNNTLQAGQ